MRACAQEVAEALPGVVAAKGGGARVSRVRLRAGWSGGAGAAAGAGARRGAGGGGSACVSACACIWSVVCV